MSSPGFCPWTADAERGADPPAALRGRHEEMREAAIAEMLRSGFSSGAGALLAQIAAAIVALAEPRGSASAHENAAGWRPENPVRAVGLLARAALAGLGPEDPFDAVHGPDGTIGAVLLGTARPAGLASN